MADAFWMQLGVQATFALEVGGRIVGIAYWLDAEGLGQGPGGEAPPTESGWYWVSVTRPREAHRVAEGLELRREMDERELAETAERALEEVANEVLAD
jgi:hypothetical protein